MGARIVTAVVLMVFGTSFAAHADMIEIKGRGVLNGKIVSQDDKEVHFEDSSKNTFVVPKGDVLFLEAQTDAPAKAAPSFTQKIIKEDAGSTFQHWRHKVEKVYKDAKYFVKSKTKWLTGAVNAPLDRSSANSRSDALAESMGDLSKNLKKLNKQDRGRTQEMKGMEGRENFGTANDGMVQQSARVGNRISKAMTDRRVSHTKHVDKGVKRYQDVSSFSLD